MDAAATAYEAIVAIAVGLHFAFVGYLVCGGFMAWRLPRTIWPHIVTGVWALGITVVAGLECPLTLVERWARARAGMAPLPESGFIAHYISGVPYPAGAAGTVRLAVAFLVAGSWAGYAVLHRRHAPGGTDGLVPHPRNPPHPPHPPHAPRPSHPQMCADDTSGRAGPAAVAPPPPQPRADDDGD